MGGQQSVEKLSEEEQRLVLDFDVSVKAFADKIKQLEKNQECGIVVMAGAGISVSAGIPDFRSPDTGLYANLQKYDLPTPQSIFDIEYFREKPQAFCMLAKEMWPGNFNPTPTHFFIKLLEKKGVLRKCFTQNIDTLEREVGIDTDLLVEAHGSFGEAHCIMCHEPHSKEWIKQEIFNDRIPKCLKCSELVKPDIVFFGEKLPKKFAMSRQEDLPDAKLLLVMGTSLSVTPFCELVHEVNARTPRMLLNLNQVGTRKMRGTEEGFRFDEVENYRDVALLKDCDSGVRLLCKYLDWEADLDKLMDDFHKNKNKSDNNNTSTTSIPSQSGETQKGSQTLEEEDEKLLNYNWKKPPPVLPPLQPISMLSQPQEVSNGDNGEGGGGGEGEGEGAAITNNENDGSLKMTCALCEPLTLSEVQGGKPAWFRIGFESKDILTSKLSHDYDYLGLYPAGSKLTDEKIDRDWPFSDRAPADILLKQELSPPSVVEIKEINEDDDDNMNIDTIIKPDEDEEIPVKISERHLKFESPYIERALRLRIPWIHYPLPYDLELWYVDGITGDVLARFGPLTIHENAPNDPKEEELQPGPGNRTNNNGEEEEEGNGLNQLNESEKQELIFKLSAEFGLPPDMIATMIKSQMGGGGQGAEEVEEVSEPDDGKSALRAGFSAFKEATATCTHDEATTSTTTGDTSVVVEKSVISSSDDTSQNLECD